MRIVLIYAPPWKIPAPGQGPYPPEEGAPDNVDEEAVSGGDFTRAPWGMLSLAAQALRAGCDVLTFNLSTYPWREVEKLISRVDAELYGLSCFTGNRRGVAMLARLIRETHPNGRVLVGGPHVSALPGETLARWKDVDVVVVGEGEATFMEIIQRLEEGRSLEGVPGTAWRNGDDLGVGAPRPRIDDLDALASPLDYFSTRTILTSRGCPGQCTFCGSKMMWGRRLNFHSVDYVLDMLQKAVQRHHHKIIAIKDDTFTASRKRVLAICEGVLSSGLGFNWSCDARADNLDEDLLRAMRIAGCRRISLGVESASPEILKNIKKRISPETVLEVTRLAQKFGIKVRYYMMVGNRGETLETFLQSLEFIEKARPNQFVFCQLHLYPGTEEFRIFQENGVVTPDIFFNEKFICLTCFAGKARDAERVGRRLARLEGVQNFRDYSVKECRAVLERLPGAPSPHMDLCDACLRDGKLDLAERHARRAMELGYYLPGLALNNLACIAAARRDYEAVKRHLNQAVKSRPRRPGIENLKLYQRWLDAGGPGSEEPLALIPGDAFEKRSNGRQPEEPGPISLNIEKWSAKGSRKTSSSRVNPLLEKCY
ncbi:MAG: radical SAM protein [Desulfobacterales bacterium]|nr:radical SAM protein [Desulfobacterales bacterium]